MPELPDLQVFSYNLNKILHGKKVKQVEVSVAKKLNVSVAELKEHLEGKAIKSVERVGKELHFTFSNNNVLALHLMLHGQLYIFEDKNTHRYPIITLHFTDGTGLVLTDYQGQATPTLNPAGRDTPDALAKEVNYAFLKRVLDGSKAAVKNILLNQQIIRGIGNAYADEILWKAGIHPFSIANKIPDKQVHALATAIRHVLTNAEKQIRETNPDIISGEVRDFLLIHNSHKTHSPTGAAIQNKTASSRKSYFTDEQELFR
ncbi:MAG: Fpg/Nei family DNA glycosylase [Taibaiella sp.]|nr:Fpg/Nei family DNA glycosylase [Taibaiella sp.]